MKLTILHQETNSRLELLLRTFLGWLYIYLPHGFLLFFVGIWSAILTFISFFIILFTGKYPQSYFEFQVGLYQWHLRVNAAMFNLVDGYPAFGVKSSEDKVKLEATNPESLSRLLLIVKLLFGFLYVGVPHGFLLFFRFIGAFVISFLGFWAILFTGKMPASFHSFLTGTLRWSMRVTFYLLFMTDEYPPFTGKEI